MRVIKTLISAIVLSGAFLSTANAAISMDAAYLCVVTNSTNTQLPVGAKATLPIRLKSLTLMKFDSNYGLDFYGDLKPYFDGVNDLVLAMHAEYTREVYATINVQDKLNGQIGMQILFLETERKLEEPAKTAQKFVFVRSNTYGLTCTEQK